MVKGIGTDILEIARIERALLRTPKLAQRILTEHEHIQYQSANDPARFLAKRFCAKEAVAKALGTGIGQGVSWKHIDVSKRPSGQPEITLHNMAKQHLERLGATTVLLTYSDEKHYVSAFALIQ